LSENLTETVRLLVVSRESAILRPLWAIAESRSWHVESAASAWDAMERVQSGVAPHLLLLDVPRGDGDSLHILRWLRRLRPDLPVVVLCFPEDAARKAEATRLGAQEVLIRPFDETRLELIIGRYLMPAESATEMASEDIEPLGLGAFFVSAGPIAQKLRAQAELLAEADVPVLILGEAGSGKDTVARLIHKHSVRSGFQFLKVNCADMPAELLEAELFGQARNGSGNGQGKFERAEKGTIYLDEITEMPVRMQAQLMRVLQDRQVRRSAGDEELPVDVRVLASTSANLERALAEGKLREDLYYRLSAFTVQVAPLRLRKAEIPALLRHLMHRVARHYSLPPREFSRAALEACQRYMWPGNVSELEAFVKRYLVAGENELSFAEPQGRAHDGGNGNHHGEGQEVAAGQRPAESHQKMARPESLKSLIQSVKSEAERNAIATALRKTEWNRKAAARLLQVSYRSLLYKIEQYQLGVPDSFSTVPQERFSFQGSKGNGNGKAS
jgi:two-component system, NtrC family, response regulator AtoC